MGQQLGHVMQFDQIKRREVFTLLGGAVVAWPRVVFAQISTRRPLVGVLTGASSTMASRYTVGFTERIEELGYLVGRDIDIVHRYADGYLGRLQAHADDLVRLKPDVLVASNTGAVIAIRHATAAIPIVAANMTDPVGLGLIARYTRPGGNVTGILPSLDTLPEKQLALAAEVVGDTVKMGMLVNAGFQAHVIQRQGAERAAAALAIKLMPVEVRVPEDLDAAFRSLVGERVSSVLVLQDPMFLDQRRRIAMLAVSARLPTMFGLREHVEAGGLMSYGIDLRANFRRAADFVDKILKGSKPSDLPVELPTKFELIVNMKTAKALGLAIPETFLVRADEVIERS